jgi:hypothetical protein
MLVFVQDAASIASSYVEVRDLVGIRERCGRRVEWAGVRDAPMGPVFVGEVLVFPQGVQEVGLVPDQGAVQ